jgi:hypothetical protein
MKQITGKSITPTVSFVATEHRPASAIQGKSRNPRVKLAEGRWSWN